MRVIFTCGGTGGHINPALAVAKLLQERRPNAQILFVGADDGMETELVPREGFRLETVHISNFQRKLSLSALRHNAAALGSMRSALKRADELIGTFQPDVILGTGGYASFPMLRQGARRGIKTAVHESNAVPGLATRMVADKVDRILVSFPECREGYKHPERVVAVGMPVRSEFIYTDRQEARKALGLDDRPVVVSAWGSLGAREMNKKIAQFMKLEAKDEPFQHIHATGTYGWRWMPDYVKELGVDLSAHKSIDMRPYLYDMPKYMAAADVFLSRAGASTLNEIAASGTPSIIIPSPNVTGNHQEKNARILENRGAALVLRENECDGARLYDEVTKLLQEPARCDSMRRALRELAVLDSAERIYGILLELAGER